MMCLDLTLLPFHNDADFSLTVLPFARGDEGLFEAISEIVKASGRDVPEVAASPYIRARVRTSRAQSPALPCVASGSPPQAPCPASRPCPVACTCPTLPSLPRRTAPDVPSVDARGLT